MATTSNIRNPGIVYPGDYTLKKIALLHVGGVLDLTSVMVELSYFEDIFSPVVSGNLVLTDALGIIEKCQLSGNEYIQITFTKASDSRAFEVNFLMRVYKISDRQLISNTTAEGYILHFCSEEMILSEQYKISKSYKNKTITDIIADIVQTYLQVPPNKVVVIENTQGIYSFIIPNLKPFEAINWLSNYARSSSPGNTGADMIFFENNLGFRFASLQTLFKQNIYRSYTPQLVNVEGQIPSDEFFAVLQYDFVNAFDMLEGISVGAFASRLITVDPLLQKFEKNDFNYSDYFSRSPTLNDFPIINSTENRFGETAYQTSEAVLKVAYTNKGHKDVPYIGNKPDSYAKDFFVENHISNRPAQLALANYNKLKLLINGDPGVVAGMLINFNLLSMDPSHPDRTTKGLDGYYSGKYLVSAVKHTIRPSSYNTTLEIIADSSDELYLTPDNNSPTWKRAVQGLL